VHDADMSDSHHGDDQDTALAAIMRQQQQQRLGQSWGIGNTGAYSSPMAVAAAVAAAGAAFKRPSSAAQRLRAKQWRYTGRDPNLSRYYLPPHTMTCTVKAAPRLSCTDQPKAKQKCKHARNF
jgi:hypothetical protein